MPAIPAQHPPLPVNSVSVGTFSNSYAALPEQFFARVAPTPVAVPKLVKLNQPLADELGLAIAGLDDETLAAIFSGNLCPAGAEPLAMAYAGHQFGHFVPQLGDGRAILLGEVIDGLGRRRDVQLKGSGPTPFSRRGDGRAALGPVLREYLVSEAMHALGIPSTRALAAVTTGEWVYREQVLPGAIVTRVAASHIRVGTFQYFAARGDVASVTRLADYVIERLYPALKDAANPYLALLETVVERQAFLVARWMLVGFVHGVMNTDNMAISGETIDFGPCAFLDGYNPSTVFSSIDERGRYAFGNQPNVAQWNLARFAETLLSIIDPGPERAVELARAAIDHFPARFEAHWLDGMRAKIGLSQAEDGDQELIQALLDGMHEHRADFTLTFRRFGDAVSSEENDIAVRALFADPQAYDAWAVRWRRRLARETKPPEAIAAAMNQVNPAFIPRNHRVEAVLKAAIDDGNFSPFEELSSILSRPYDDQPDFAAYAESPPPSDRPYRTFCGT